MRLIDADALDKETRVKNLSLIFPDWYDLTIAEKSALIKLNQIFSDIIRKQQSIDAVPVVRCKECKWFFYDDDVDYVCAQSGKYMGFDDFCSHGVRKN